MGDGGRQYAISSVVRRCLRVSQQPSIHCEIGCPRGDDCGERWLCKKDRGRFGRPGLAKSDSVGGSGGKPDNAAGGNRGIEGIEVLSAADNTGGLIPSSFSRLLGLFLTTRHTTSPTMQQTVSVEKTAMKNIHTLGGTFSAEHGGEH